MAWRTVLRANAKQKVQDYADANPNKLRAVYLVRPGSFRETPCAYIGTIRVDFLHTQGVRQANAEVDVVVVDNVVDNEEAVTNVDEVVDALTEDFTDDPHLFGSNTVQEPIRSESTDLDVDEVPYHGQVLTLGRIVIAEGRI